MDKFTNSVHLEEDKCVGCINCIKRCPTQAIRVRNGKAVIIKKFCIDCGECIRTCKHHAKKAVYDKLSVLEKFKYTVALPAPSLYGQFNNLEDVNIVLTGLKRMGFDDVYEVSAAAEIVSSISRKYVEAHPEGKPFISTACPSVVRLIRVRFPNLIEHLLPVVAPVDLAARYARQMAVKKTGLKPEEIGIIFISPCPAKVTAKINPIGIEKSDIDAVVAVKDVYPSLANKHMRDVADNPEELATSGKIGISWGRGGGEAAGLLTDSYLSADGIENVIRVLEDLEDQKLDGLDFIELNACEGGCVGGVLNVENPFMAKAKIEKLRKYMPVSRSHSKDILEEMDISELVWENEVTYEPVFKLGTNMMDSFAKMNQINELLSKFPKLDCGSCGAPTCQALAEDIVRGDASETDCIHVLRELYYGGTDEKDDKD